MSKFAGSGERRVADRRRKALHRKPQPWTGYLQSLESRTLLTILITPEFGAKSYLEINSYTFHNSNGNLLTAAWSPADFAYRVEDGNPGFMYLTPIWTTSPSYTFSGYELKIELGQSPVASGTFVSLATDPNTDRLGVSFSGPAPFGQPFYFDSGTIRHITLDAGAYPYDVESLPSFATLTVNQFGAPSHLVILPPTPPFPAAPSVAGEVLKPAVRVGVLDDNGIPVTDDTSSITATPQFPTNNTLSGTTIRNAVAGIATFDDFSLADPGFLSIIFSAPFTQPMFQNEAYVSGFVGPPHLVFSQPISDLSAGSSLGPVTVKLVDNSEVLMTNSSMTVTLGISSGPDGAFLQGDASLTLDHGIATFGGLSLPVAGTYVLSVSTNGMDGGIPNAISNFFNVSPGPLDHMRFVQGPSTAVAGETFAQPLSVEMDDALGNAITASTNVTMSIVKGPPGAILSGTTTANSSSGVAVFNGLVLTKAGDYTFKAVAGQYAATSDSFTISPAAASKLVPGPVPTRVGAGAFMTLTVDVQDVYGNLVANDSSNISIALSGDSAAPAMVGATPTQVVRGHAVFSNIVVPTAGTYSFVASDSEWEGGFSSHSFTVVPGGTAQLRVEQQAVQGYAGRELSLPIRISAIDAYGNLASNDAGNLTLKIITAPSRAKMSGGLNAPLQQGVASFNNVQFSKPGLYRVKVSDSYSHTVKLADVAVVLPPTHLVFLRQPASTVVGHPIVGPIVLLEDAKNHVVTADQSTVQLSGPGLQVQADAVKGKAVFDSFYFSRAGKYTVTASAKGMRAIVSKAFTLLPDSTTARPVLVQSPSDSTLARTVGAPLTVWIEDVYQNLITSDHSVISVTLVRGPTGGHLSGIGSVAVVKGVAKFPKIIVTIPGDYTLQITDSLLKTMDPLTVDMTVT